MSKWWFERDLLKEVKKTVGPRSVRKKANQHAREASHRQITAKTIKKMLQDEGVYVDVRRWREYEDRIEVIDQAGNYYTLGLNGD